MAEGVIGLSDVSSKDTGKGKELKTGNLKRSYNMAGEGRKGRNRPIKLSECPRGQVYNTKLKKCMSKNYKGYEGGELKLRRDKVGGLKDTKVMHGGKMRDLLKVQRLKADNILRFTDIREPRKKTKKRKLGDPIG